MKSLVAMSNKIINIYSNCGEMCALRISLIPLLMLQPLPVHPRIRVITEVGKKRERCRHEYQDSENGKSSC